MSEIVTVVSSVPLTEPVICNRLFPFFEKFHERGFCVRCICPRGELDVGSLPGHLLLEEVDISAAKPNGFFRRAIKEIRDASVALRKAGRLEGDVVIVSIPSMFLAFLAPYYLRDKKIIVDVRDLSWEYLSDTSFSLRLAKQFLRYLFKKTISRSYLVSVTNETELSYVQTLYPRGEVIHVSNGIRQGQFDKLLGVRVSQEESFTVTYIGNVGLAQRLDTLVEAARSLPYIKFRVVGGGTDLERIKGLVAKYSLENFELIGRVSWDEVINYYSSTDVLYAQLAPEFAGAMPSKLYEYFSTGKHVVFGGEGQAVETLRNFESYDVIGPCDPVELVSKLAELSKKLDRTYLSIVNREVIEGGYIREVAAEQFAGRLAELVRFN